MHNICSDNFTKLLLSSIFQGRGTETKIPHFEFRCCILYYLKTSIATHHIFYLQLWQSLWIEMVDIWCYLFYFVVSFVRLVLTIHNICRPVKCHGLVGDVLNWKLSHIHMCKKSWNKLNCGNFLDYIFI